ncbi:protein ORANGE-LIKE, chloroplastic-like [Salvia divinorum]|uniref:Protein ORANGE-LIKE, chloroplastic-like n=1 Tax=Salvia divinorum TaxID=28513 RepID=A0ABD1H3Q6_SALDI
MINVCLFPSPKLRRLRVQQCIKSMKFEPDDDSKMPEMPSTIPFLFHMNPRTLRQLYSTGFSIISGIIVFGGLIAPTLELKLGLGGTSYADFISKLHLPMQLSQVDPIVASFSGGAQEKKRCKYCHGTGYLACARCSANGLCVSPEPLITSATDGPLNAPTNRRCQSCSGSGKVMCPTCLCTGMIMASEHDPRFAPFD